MAGKTGLYVLRHTHDPSEMLPGKIETYPWGCAYRPETVFRAGWTENGIRVLMECREADPLRRVKQPNGNVWCDSCMEFFVAPGETAADGYFNFEMNANGALLLGWGVSDTEFVLSDFPREKIALRAEVYADRWALNLIVPFALFRRHMPGFVPTPGKILHGNFYKCGDETASPHFGCYFPIDPASVPTPCFHVPEYYGKLLLEE